MSLSNRFRIYEPKVTHETIDGEVVIINLDTGNYYSMTKAGAAIWNLIAAGATVEQIIAAVSNQYVGNREEIAGSVTELVGRLQQEGLIVLHHDEQTSFVVSEASPNPKRVEFERPQLDKFTDMEDLLLLDPIHDVDDTGWPNKNPGN